MVLTIKRSSPKMETLLPFMAIGFGLLSLVWSADHFVEGSSAISKHMGMPPLLIGMIVIGFGTSVPEMLVSALAAFEGKSGIALGNAYGSNITNIALILGVTAIINPIRVDSGILKRELPLLTLISFLAAFQLSDHLVTRFEAIVLLFVFVIVFSWIIYQSLNNKNDNMAVSLEKELQKNNIPINKAIYKTLLGLIFLVISSKIIVWGAIEIALFLKMSELVIGLTIVAIGTSLPELASSFSAAKKGEHELALGNILGSNLFNTLAVVGISGIIQPLNADPEVFFRDIPVMIGLTTCLFVLGFGFKKSGRINRVEGLILFVCFLGYSAYLILN